MKNGKCVVCFSGGMDSTVLLYNAVKFYKQVLALSFVYGQRHAKELDAAREIVKGLPSVTHKVIDVSFFKDLASKSALTNTDIDVAKAKDVMGDPQTVNYVPFRNMMLLSIASAAAESIEADTVMYGAAQADSVAGYWDGSDEFLTAINGVNILNRRNKIKIEAPLIEMSKSEIITWGKKLKVPFDKTWTCYEGKEEACGTCTACSLRLQGFIDAGIQDPISYERDILWDTLFSR